MSYRFDGVKYKYYTGVIIINALVYLDFLSIYANMYILRG